MMKTLFAVSLAALLATACAADKPLETIRAGPFTDYSDDPEAPSGAIAARPMPSAPLDGSKTFSRIVFASCAQQNEDQSIWDQIAAENPELVLYIGDNVYGDVRSNDPALPELKAAYMRLSQSKSFARVRAGAPVLTVWDDHDYGANDAGANYPYKEQSEALFDYVWAVPENDPRRARPGVYGAWMLGEEIGRRIQLIMLDTRYFRSDLKATDERGAHGKERYLPNSDPSKTMLGETQWAWLAEQLREPADLRLLVSSVQVIADGHGWEGWKTLPAERDKLFATIKASGAENIVILSGDRHSAALYARDDATGSALFEATSSSLNLPASAWRAQRGETYIEPGPHRIGAMIYDANYGLIDIDWAAGAATVSIRGGDGATLLSQTVAFGAMKQNQ